MQAALYTHPRRFIEERACSLGPLTKATNLNLLLRD
jgi:hypothetical protein